LQTAGVDEERFRRLRMVVAALDAAADGSADDDRRRVLPAGPVAQLPQLVHDLIEGGIDEVAELHFGHGPQPVERHPDGGADDPAFRERRVDYSIGTELLVEAGGGAEHAAELPDVLA